MKNRIPSPFLFAILMVGLTSCAQKDNGIKLEDLKIGFYKSNLEFIEVSLNEDFSPDSLNYTADVEKSYTASVYVTPVAADSTVRIMINDADTQSDMPVKTDLMLGENIINIALLGKRGASVTYRLTVTQTDLSEVYISELIAPGIWRIGDFGGTLGNENMYLVEGAKKALLFDTGMGKGDLAAYIRTLTNLPIEVAITHGHRDHFMQLDQFKESTVYMSKLDESRLPKDIITPQFKWIKEGDIIDIGNGKQFEVIEIPGHSMGCLIFLDIKNKYAVVGDGIGSGSMVYMFSAASNSLSNYYSALKHLEEKIKELDGLTLLTGHNYQEKIPLTGAAGKQYITDMRIAAQKVLDGELTGEVAYSIRDTTKIELRQAYYGMAGLWYNPYNLGK